MCIYFVMRLTGGKYYPMSRGFNNRESAIKFAREYCGPDVETQYGRLWYIETLDYQND